MTTFGEAPPVTMFGPDFPFGYDRWLAHPDGLGMLPADRLGTSVAVVGGGIAGIVAAYELMRLGLRPVVFEAEQLGGRMRSVSFPGHPGAIAELGAMRFPPAATTLFHYIGLAGLSTRPFPNPLAPATPYTVVDVNGERHFARDADDLPTVYQEVADAWAKLLEEGADFSAVESAIRRRDTPTLKALWNRLVPLLDDQSFYGFLAASPAFASFRHREIFGQVGFGTGGWDTDFPNSMLEILRVVYTGADDRHLTLAEGAQQLPLRLWDHAPDRMAHWPAGTSLAALHPGGPRPAVARISRGAGGFRVDAVDGSGEFPAVVLTPQVRLLLNRIDTAEDLFTTDVWTAVERTHYMGASKLFALVDRPFWTDVDHRTGRPAMGMTLTDRSPRGVYLFDGGPAEPGVMCLSYTWNDDSLKTAALPPAARLDVMLRHLGRIYPGTDIRSRVIAAPVTVTWETEPNFMGAFKANLPGHYRYQRRLYTHFMQRGLPSHQRGVFLAGDDVSWTGGFAEGAVTTALNAVWGVLNHLGGVTPATNPGPGDAFDTIAPVDLPL
ncbi:flavin monoamine oxidase family protein [Actinoplanes derwentensis]|uniref:Tryptophan 2-monooxygenase n=1 Tax=Actinoplanes derwentensis TaxID=113562 RepID=A0A1H1Y9X4_9ACTN|nr:NAD(P)/FAD-dependent oxidoreductase [Actinoplanes derwentensis]GID90470.1 tryptophan synthase subunit alpha [Actinoplanes derwentensis]SDT18260.1 tryptophan 2-monooxygenase [Actinoplanes derwentensis]